MFNEIHSPYGGLMAVDQLSHTCFNLLKISVSQYSLIVGHGYHGGTHQHPQVWIFIRWQLQNTKGKENQEFEN